MTATRRPWLGDLLPELALAAAGFAGYLLVRWATLDRTPDAVANARDVLALEEALGLDREHAIQVATFTSTPWLGHAATHVYVWGYLPVLVAATVFGSLMVSNVGRSVPRSSSPASWGCSSTRSTPSLRRGSATTASPTPSARPLSRPSPVPRGS